MFDRCVATIFATLYDKFPVRTRITFTTDWPESLFDEEESVAEIAMKAVVFQHTVSWLRDAGYVWTSDITDSNASDVVLTPKALQVLKSIPPSLDESETVGAWIQRAVKDGAKDAVQKGVAYALGIGVTAIAG